MCLHDKKLKWMGGGGVKEDKWDTYIRAKQKGEIDLLQSELGPACYKLSTAATNMHVHTCAHTEMAISRKHIRKTLSGKEQSEEDGEHRESQHGRT